MLIMVKVLSAQQNWDVATGETANSLILEYRGWQFSAPISDDDLQGVLAAMRVDAATPPSSEAPSVRTVDFRGVQEPKALPVEAPPVVGPPAVFASGLLVDSRDERLAAMRARAREATEKHDGVPVAAVERDEDGIQQD